MRIIAVLFCGALAACNQTGTNAGSPQTAANEGAAPKPAGRHALSPETRCQEAIAKAQQQSTKAAVLGSALSMAGGLGGFGGRGGAIAAQAVSMGGSVMQAKAEDDTRNAVEQECMP